MAKQKKHAMKRKLRDSQDDKNEIIQQWREERQKKMNARKPYVSFYVHTFSLKTLYSFAQNINFMVLIQMICAGVAVYIFQTYHIWFDLHVTLFVSPIVFPLAFSINTDFQRREKVLEDLAQFKSSGMIWYFCMRDWRQAAQLDNEWFSIVHAKRRSVLFHIREFLLTDKLDRRKIILRAIYEDFSDMNQLIEKLRASKLPANTAIISRAIHLLNMMCLSFERLRVIREYRSPRSIRSFNKVLIMILPIILSPYFVHVGIQSDNNWEPYFISILVAFVFSALQGVQDKLDDPFDGMSEDDIQLDTFDEWNCSLEYVMKRKVYSIRRVKENIERYYNQFKLSFDEMVSKKDRNQQSSISRRRNGSKIYTIHKSVRDSESSRMELSDAMINIPNTTVSKLSPTGRQISRNNLQVHSYGIPGINYDPTYFASKKKIRQSLSWDRALVNDKKLTKTGVGQRSNIKHPLHRTKTDVVQHSVTKRASIAKNNADEKRHFPKTDTEKRNTKLLSVKTDENSNFRNTSDQKFQEFPIDFINTTTTIPHLNNSSDNQDSDVLCTNTMNPPKQNLKYEDNGPSTDDHINVPGIVKDVIHCCTNVNKQMNDMNPSKEGDVKEGEETANDPVLVSNKSYPAKEGSNLKKQKNHFSTNNYEKTVKNDFKVPEKLIYDAIQNDKRDQPECIPYCPNTCPNNLNTILDIAPRIPQISTGDTYKVKSDNSRSLTEIQIIISSHELSDESFELNRNMQFAKEVLTSVNESSEDDHRVKNRTELTGSGTEEETSREQANCSYNQADARGLVTSTWNILNTNIKRKFFANGRNVNHKYTS